MVACMGIFDRIGQAAASQINALLDKAEDPGASLESSIEAMREAIRAARHEVVLSVAAEKQLKSTIEQLDTEIETYGRRAEWAVRRGDDDLARQALVHKRRLTLRRDRAEALRGEQRTRALETKDALGRMGQRLRDIENRKGTLATMARQAAAGGGTEALGAKPGVAPFEEFRRIEGEVEAVELAFEAQREVDQALGGRGSSGLLDAEVEARFRSFEGQGGEGTGDPVQGDLRDELETLKKKIRVST